MSQVGRIASPVGMQGVGDFSGGLKAYGDCKLWSAMVTYI